MMPTVERDVVSPADALRPFLSPRTIAVVGVSRTRGGVGAEIFHNIVAARFTGTVIPINPRAVAIGSIRAYPSVLDVPQSIDLAIIAVPASCVDAAVDDCIVKRIPALVVIAAGFRETGEAGRLWEAALCRRVREAGLRMIGPNCLGLLTTDPAVSLN